MRGGFWLPKRELFVPNVLVEEGRTSFLKMIMQGNNIDVPAGNNFYVGLCGEAGVGPTSTLVNISDELAVANGYARQAFSRDATGVPTLDVINGQAHTRSAVVTFTASGGDFSGPYSRFFVCNVASGSSGILYSFSAQIDPAVTITNGNSEDFQYDLYF